MFFLLLILLGKERQLMPALFFYFASNKNHCKSQWTSFVLSLLQNTAMTTDHYSVTLRAHILSNHHRRWHSIISRWSLVSSASRLHLTEHSSLHYKDQSGWEVINEHGSPCKAILTTLGCIETCWWNPQIWNYEIWTPSGGNRCIPCNRYTWWS